MSDAFLDACDEWVFHRLLTTIALGGSVVIVSSWCRARFIQKCGKFGLALLPLVLQLPFTSVDTVDTGFQFAYSSTSPNLPGAGKVFFKDSLGMIDKSAEPLALHANVSDSLPCSVWPLLKRLVTCDRMLFSISYTPALLSFSTISSLTSSSTFDSAEHLPAASYGSATSSIDSAARRGMPMHAIKLPKSSSQPAPAITSILVSISTSPIMPLSSTASDL